MVIIIIIILTEWYDTRYNSTGAPAKTLSEGKTIIMKGTKVLTLGAGR